MFFHTNLERNSSLLLKNLRNKKLIVKEFFHRILDDVERVSTIHGWERMFHRTSKKLERILWSLSFIVAFVIFVNVASKICYVYRYTPLKTVIAQLQHPVFKVPFPEVVICNQNRFNWLRFDEAKSRFLLAQHRTPQHEEMFAAVVNAYDTLKFGKFDNFERISYHYPPILLLDLNYINFTQVSEFMAWKCHEMFTECSWIENQFDCCKILSVRKSQMGLCMAFNSIVTPEGLLTPSTDPYYPWRTKGSGPENGLNLRIHINEALHSPMSDLPKGLIIMTIEPYVWSFEGHFIPANSRAYVAIEGFRHYFDDTTRLFPSDVRQCVFEGELESQYYKSLQNHKYMFENCQAECQQEYLMRLCNCTMDLFYPPGPYRACKLTDLPCLYKHNRILQNFEQHGEREFVSDYEDAMNCPCFFNCNSLNYFVDVHVDHLSHDGVDPNCTQVEMSVFFVWETIKVYKTTAVYTVLDLMASLGGLAGLCIGCSLVGITELLYFFFIDVPKQAIACCKMSTNLSKRKRTLRARRIFVKEITLT